MGRMLAEQPSMCWRETKPREQRGPPLPCPRPVPACPSKAWALSPCTWTSSVHPAPCRPLSHPSPVFPPLCSLLPAPCIFPDSEHNSLSALLFQKGNFSPAWVGISRMWDCEMHVGRRQNAWVAFEGNFVELVLLALNIHTTYTFFLLSPHFEQIQCKCDGG